MDKIEFKALPKFESEDEEREFWATHESSDYVDWSKAAVVNGKEAFPNLRPTEDLLVFRIPKDEVDTFNSIAKKYHLTKDDLALRFVEEGLLREQGRARA